MKKYPFYIVDVFTERKYTGNQLAVIRQASDISDDKMLAIAKEMNYSETTFILSDEEKNGGWDVRIFTPDRELPFAGHPTLGTAFIIRRELLRDKVDSLTLNLKVGQIPVNVDTNNIFWMRQNEPEFGKTYTAEDIAATIGLKREDIDEKFPVQEVSTGMFALICPLRTIEAVKSIKFNNYLFTKLVGGQGPVGMLLFAPQTELKENHLHARFPTILQGVPEDPATGSANGCLAAYLVKHRYFGSPKVDVRVEQGYEIGRPSLLMLKSEDRGSSIEVNVGGGVVMIASGELY